MVTGFEFATAARVLFGAGCARDLPQLVCSFGARVLVVTGANRERIRPCLAEITDAGVAAEILSIPSEPAVSDVVAGAEAARAAQCKAVVAIGGGSVVDAGKAIAALATNTAPVFDYLEVIGRAQPLSQTPLPFIAVPTTAGTGAEVTRNAVLFSQEHRVKVSLRSPRMLPAVALVDPELTHDLPPALTASTGMDALTQLIEPLVCSRANPMTDALCREAIPRAARALPRAYHDGRDAVARSEMSLASLFGGMALANAGLGAAHGFAAPIGGMFAAPHGAICAALLPHVMEMNLAVARRDGVDETLRRYEETARLLTGNAAARAKDGVQWVRDLCLELNVRSLSALGIPRAAFDEIVVKATGASSMKANPVALAPAELKEILVRAG